MTIKVNVDNQSIGTDTSNRLYIKISSAANNGLSINSDGQIVATRGKDGSSGSGGTMNTPGNGIAGTAGSSLAIVGYGSTVSRHRKYTGSDTFCKNNDGLVMVATTINSDGSISINNNDQTSVAYKILHH